MGAPGPGGVCIWSNIWHNGSFSFPLVSPCHSRRWGHRCLLPELAHPPLRCLLRSCFRRLRPLRGPMGPRAGPRAEGHSFSLRQPATRALTGNFAHSSALAPANAAIEREVAGLQHQLEQSGTDLTAAQAKLADDETLDQSDPANQALVAADQ